jgi:integrase/recombinase XerD
VSWPADLESALRHYLARHRPVLLARAPRRDAPLVALFVSKHGRQMSGAAIRHQIAAHTVAAFGRSLSPHLFRDGAATAIAIGSPQQIGIVPQLLGHSTLTTSERHYNLAGSLEAGRSYARTIAALRSPQRIVRRRTPDQN